MKGLDLRKFKKIKVEDDHTMLAHPSGHEIKISHKLISRDLKSQLDKLPMHMNEGGVAKDKSQPSMDKDKAKLVQDSFNAATGSQSIVDKFKHAFGYNQGTPDEPIQGEEQPVMASKLESQYMPEEATAQQMSTPMPQSDPRADIAAALKNMSAHYAAQPQQTPPEIQSMTVPPTPGPTAVGTQPSSMGANTQPSPDLPPKVPMTHTPHPTGDLAQQAQTAVNQQNAADAKMASNTQEADKVTAGLYENQAKQMHVLQQEYEGHRSNIMSHYNQLADHIATEQIDPNHWWNTRSTGGQILTAIGMLFAGATTGAAGHPEMVNQIIDKVIDRDINAQKSNLDNKHNLLSKYMDMYKSLPEAEAATRLTLNAVTEGLLKQQAAKLGSQNAVLMSQQLQAQRQQQLLPTLEGLTMAQLKMNSLQQPMNDNDPAAKVRRMGLTGIITTQQQEEAFKELDRVQHHKEQVKTVTEAFDRANRDNTLAGRLTHGSSEPASVAAFQNLIMPYLKDAAGRVNETELERTDKLLPRPGDGKQKVLEKRKALLDFMNEKASSSTLKGLGIQTNTSSSSEGSESTSKSGKPIVFKNGQWMYK